MIEDPTPSAAPAEDGAREKDRPTDAELVKLLRRAMVYAQNEACVCPDGSPLFRESMALVKEYDNAADALACAPAGRPAPDGPQEKK